MASNLNKMNSELRRLYNDHMQEAVMGEGARYTIEERAERTLSLLEKGVLSQGIDFYHAALLIQNAQLPGNRMTAYKLFMRAGQLGYAGAFHMAAMQYDNWLLSQGKPQKFGTHWTWEGDVAVPQPLEDPDRVDEVRAELGLRPIAVEAQEITARRQVRDR